MRRWLDHLRSFRSNDRGNIALLFGVTLVPMVGAAGVAIDYSTASNVRTSLQNEVDATALEVAKAAVDIQVNPDNSTKSATQRQALVDAQVALILAARKPIVEARNVAVGAVQFTGEWADTLKTQYKVTTTVDTKRHIRVLSSQPTTRVAVSATAGMSYDAILKPGKPEMIRPGFNAGDYNRLYAYCYNGKETDVSKRRTQMTAVTSNGQSGSSMEVDTADIFKNVLMPECDVDKGETLSWRLLNIRNSRTNPSNWPKDVKGSMTMATYANGAVKWDATYTDGVTTSMTTGGTVSGAPSASVTKDVWRTDEPSHVNSTSTNPTVRGLYNHYSDTKVDINSGLESFSFSGDQMGYYAPINIMETVVCDTKDLCNPDKPGSIVPKGDNRTPSPAMTKCEPGKFMFIGFEDRPYVPGRPAGDYSNWGSGYWTDRDYEDVTFVVSCPSLEIQSYKQKIWLLK